MSRNKPEPRVINVTYQLKGKDADEFEQYMRREFIDHSSVAGKKLTLERLRELSVNGHHPAPAVATTR